MPTTDQAANPRFAVLDALAASHTDIFDAVDSLRDTGLQRELIPKLVVVGDQKSGKSSVLEAITRIPFPIDERLCTRFPTELILRRSDKHVITVTIHPSSSGDEAQKDRLRAFKKEFPVDDESRLIATMKDASNLILGGLPNATYARRFSDDILRIVVSGPERYPLALVDLPGLFESETGEQSRNDKRYVQRMVRSYVTEPRNALLLIISAATPRANLLAYAEITRADADKHGRRTLGIVSKVDNPDSVTNVLSLFQEEGEWKLRHGWHCLRNRTPGERRLGVDRDEAESDYFARESVWNVIPRESKGIDFLRPRLGKLLAEQIAKHLPALIVDVRKEQAFVEEELSKLRAQRITEQSQRSYLSQMAVRFEHLACDAVNGHYGNGMPQKLKAFFSCREDSLQKSQDKRLQAVARAMTQVFHAVMVLKGKSTEVEEPDDGSEFFSAGDSSSEHSEHEEDQDGGQDGVQEETQGRAEEAAASPDAVPAAANGAAESSAAPSAAASAPPPPATPASAPEAAAAESGAGADGESERGDENERVEEDSGDQTPRPNRGQRRRSPARETAERRPKFHDAQYKRLLVKERRLRAQIKSAGLILRDSVMLQYDAFPLPTLKNYEDFEGEVTEMAARFRGTESLQEVNPELLSELMRLEACRWKEISMSHLRLVWDAVVRFVDLALEYCVDAPILPDLRQIIINDRLAKLRQRVEERLLELLNCHDGVNPAFHDMFRAFDLAVDPPKRGASFTTSGVSKTLTNRIYAGISRKQMEKLCDDVSTATGGGFVMDKLGLARKLAEHLSGMLSLDNIAHDVHNEVEGLYHRDMERMAVRRTIDTLKEYYFICLVTFSANVSALVIQNGLLNRMPFAIFTHDIVAEQDAETIAMIAGEKEGDARNRKELERKAKTLKEALGVFEEYNRSMQ